MSREFSFHLTGVEANESSKPRKIHFIVHFRVSNPPLFGEWRFLTFLEGFDAAFTFVQFAPLVKIASSCVFSERVWHSFHFYALYTFSENSFHWNI